MRRATERYGSLNSRKVFNSLFQPLEKEACNTNHEVSSKLDDSPEIFGPRGDDSDKEIKRLERVKRSSMSSDVCPSNEIDAQGQENLVTKDLEEIKKSDALLVPNDFLCPISLELMRDPIIVATGQVFFTCFFSLWQVLPSLFIILFASV